MIVGDATAFAVQQPEVHGGLRLTVEFEAQRIVFRGKFDRQKRDFPKHKRHIHATEQRVNAFHHAGRGSPVGIERIVRINLTAGFHVGENIRTAESVNGLLRIAD